MTIQPKRKWMMLIFILLLAAAIAAGTSQCWKEAEQEKTGKGYVAVIRIDGGIYGGPETDSVLNVAVERLVKKSCVS